MLIVILIAIIILIGFSIVTFLFNRSKWEEVMRHLNRDERNDIESETTENEAGSGEEISDEGVSTHNNNTDEREESNRSHLMDLLEDMGCHPSLNEDRNLSFSYQGENFLIMFNGAFLRIWDLSWLSMKNTDDNYTLFKDATNYANFSFGPTVVLHSPDENGNIIFSSRLDIPFAANMNDGKGYITALLDSFFGLKNSLHREINRLKDDPHDRTLHDNPIGFDTASLSDPSSPQAN
ncbi:MAG: hypothetical protein K2H96_01685 [Muribaculaceae bacterium]|nr:hypothetical protein [Muribaculaceae bacterium]